LAPAHKISPRGVVTSHCKGNGLLPEYAYVATPESAAGTMFAMRFRAEPGTAGPWDDEKSLARLFTNAFVLLLFLTQMRE